ncbi:MAG: LL-diaminopimelate aminotransferase [Ruminococcaceae bacterium]|nr:LL-diaminopimelate aminotransferase [Oscillospiraceae bacterium]
MLKPNPNYASLNESYLFYNIAQKVREYQINNPDKKLLHLGIGDVSLPLCKAVITELHNAVNEQASKDTFHGYMPECGAPFLREAISDYYKGRNIEIEPDEVFVSSGASDELGDIQDLFDKSSSALIIEPAYPAYVDANIMAGRKIIHFPSGENDGFAPYPDEKIKADIIYICSPNNPTGAVFTKEKLAAWVEYANKNGSVILFDAAYEAFIENEDIPHSIFEIDGAKECAIEICSLSKTAGFTGTRLGYTVIPKNLERNKMNLNSMWIRNRTTKTNGVSYIIQKGASAVFTPEGQKQIRENLNVYKKNAKILAEAFDSVGLWYCGGKNAPYLFVKCPENKTSWEFFDYLLNEHQIIGTPGIGFGQNVDAYFRFTSFGSEEETALAAERIKNM